MVGWRQGGFVEFVGFVEFIEFIQTGDSWRLVEIR
jgi:hypothetical protein